MQTKLPDDLDLLGTPSRRVFERVLEKLALAILATLFAWSSVSGQTPSEPPGIGFSVGAFYFLSGLRPGAVMEVPLTWGRERDTALEAWASLVPDDGLGAALGLRAGRGVVRGGLGVAAIRSAGDFAVGPGLQLGVTVPAGGGHVGASLHASYHAYWTNEGYVPLLRLVFGPWRIGS